MLDEQCYSPMTRELSNRDTILSRLGSYNLAPTGALMSPRVQ